MATTNTPVFTMKEGPIKASIWQNPSSKGSFHNLTVVRSYKDAEGAWKDSISFGLSDLSNLLMVTVKALEWMRRNRPPTTT